MQNTLTMMNSSNPNAPIGVFDSGVGGISVLKHIRVLMPHEQLLYVADSKFAPYGSKSPELIIERADAIAQFLIQKGVKALVVACNTATAAAAETLRANYALPIIGMEPAVKPAAQATKTGVIGVLATSGTLKSAQFSALLEHYGQHVQVVTQACHGLVECIERGDLNSSETKALLQSYIQPLLEANADTIVLGCTHYPFVRHLIEQLIPKHVVLIDTGAAVAKHLKNRLDALGLLANTSRHTKLEFWTNSEHQDAAKVMSQLWGESVRVNHFND